MAVIHPPQFEPPRRGMFWPIMILLWLALYGSVIALSRQSVAASDVATASKHDYNPSTGDE